MNRLNGHFGCHKNLLRTKINQIHRTTFPFSKQLTYLNERQRLGTNLSELTPQIAGKVVKVVDVVELNPWEHVWTHKKVQNSDNNTDHNKWKWPLSRGWPPQRHICSIANQVRREAIMRHKRHVTWTAGWSIKIHQSIIGSKPSLFIGAGVTYLAAKYRGLSCLSEGTNKYK